MTLPDPKAFKRPVTAGTGLKGQPLGEIIARFWGDLEQWPVAPDGTGNWTRPEILAISGRIQATGACMWHAMAEMMVWTNCHCSPCARAAEGDVR